MLLLKHIPFLRPQELSWSRTCDLRYNKIWAFDELLKWSSGRRPLLFPQTLKLVRPDLYSKRAACEWTENKKVLTAPLFNKNRIWDQVYPTLKTSPWWTRANVRLIWVSGATMRDILDIEYLSMMKIRILQPVKRQRREREEKFNYPN